MPEWNAELKQFMVHWFAGLFDGLSGLDPCAQEAVLGECGRACARSYTARVFRETWQESADLDAFLSRLARHFPEARYERVGPRAVRVRYDRCACDLVRQGLVRSPLLCRCSAHNLEENFRQALGVPVTATLESSILAGETECVFVVSWAG